MCGTPAWAWQQHNDGVLDFIGLGERLYPRSWHTNINWCLDCSCEAFTKPQSIFLRPFDRSFFVELLFYISFSLLGLYKRILLAQKAVKSGQMKKKCAIQHLVDSLFTVWKPVKCCQIKPNAKVFYWWLCQEWQRCDTRSHKKRNILNENLRTWVSKDFI